MINTLFGFKQKQTQYYLENGNRIPVTYILAGPCFITQIINKDGQNHVQLGFGSIKRTTKAQDGHFKKAGLIQKLRFLRDIKVNKIEETDIIGKQVLVEDVFSVNDVVNITGTSKGKGFASAIKRYHFKGGPRTHGQSDRERAPGSIGQTTTPGRVYKGKKMAGRMGSDQVTVKGLKIVQIDAEKNLIVVKGLIPGTRLSIVKINKI